MSSPTPGSDPNYPQGCSAGPARLGRASAAGPGLHARRRPTPAAPAGTARGQRPGMVTAAAIIGIVWGALGLLFGLLAARRRLRLRRPARAPGRWCRSRCRRRCCAAGIQVIQGKSPRLLLLISYVAIGDQHPDDDHRRSPRARSIFSYLLGFILPGIIVFLLLQPAVQAVLRRAGHQLLS